MAVRAPGERGERKKIGEKEWLRFKYSWVPMTRRGRVHKGRVKSKDRIYRVWLGRGGGEGGQRDIYHAAVNDTSLYKCGKRKGQLSCKILRTQLEGSSKETIQRLEITDIRGGGAM